MHPWRALVHKFTNGITFALVTGSHFSRGYLGIRKRPTTFHSAAADLPAHGDTLANPTGDTLAKGEGKGKNGDALAKGKGGKCGENKDAGKGHDDVLELI